MEAASRRAVLWPNVPTSSKWPYCIHTWWIGCSTFTKFFDASQVWIKCVVYFVYMNISIKSMGIISTFSWGAKFFFYYSMPPDCWKIGKNSTLYVVIWHYSYLPSFFFFSFSFFFLLGGRRPPSPPQMTPLIKRIVCLSLSRCIRTVFKIQSWNFAGRSRRGRPGTGRGGVKIVGVLLWGDSQDRSWRG